MDKLWAPWRINYIKQKETKGCLFCNSKKAKKGSLVVFQTRHSLCMLNKFPYNNGHLMVSPLKHVTWLSALNKEETLDLFKSLENAKKLLDQVLKPQGYNIGINYLETAGAGIAQHLHIHIVPRWKGDTNFMPVIFKTKVISQSLQELEIKLKNAQSKSNKRTGR